jgi:hypothetical protein
MRNLMGASYGIREDRGKRMDNEEMARSDYNQKLETIEIMKERKEKQKSSR